MIGRSDAAMLSHDNQNFGQLLFNKMVTKKENKDYKVKVENPIMDVEERNSSESSLSLNIRKDPPKEDSESMTVD